VAEQRPRGAAEEGVVLHVGCTGAGTQAAEFVLDEELADQGLAEAGSTIVSQIAMSQRKSRADLLGDVWRSIAFWERHFVSQDIRECGIPVLALERCGTEQHLIDQDTQCPPVHSACVSASLDHLWRNVFFCSNKRVRSEVRNTRLRVDRRQVVIVRVRSDAARRTRGCVHHCRRSTRVGLLGEIEV
jgi:hypothetical protein